MINKDFFLALDVLEKERGIKKDHFLEILESALVSAYKKEYGEAQSISVKIFPDKNTIKVFAYKTVVEVIEDEDKEISIEEAQKIKKKHKLGDIVQNEVTPKDFGRIAAQTARQVVFQKIREVEKNTMLSNLESKEGDILTGLVRRIDERGVYLEIGLDHAEGVLSVRDQIPGEDYRIGDRLKVYGQKVKDDYRGTQLSVSRTVPSFVQKLFEYEVPEIASGEVVIKNVAREAGLRTKIAVYANDDNLDAIGACVGNKGMRVNAVSEELNGEKIDIIPYSDIPSEFIAAAMSPARIASIECNEATKTANILVPADKLSLAIGRQGHNVRLAARLTGWKIDVKSEEKAVAEIKIESTKVKNIVIDDSFSETDDELFADLD